MLRQLPADATIDDAIERLAFLATIERGVAALDPDHDVRHVEMKGRFDALVAAGIIWPPVEQGDPFEDWPDIRLSRGTAQRLVDEGSWGGLRLDGQSSPDGRGRDPRASAIQSVSGRHISHSRHLHSC